MFGHVREELVDAGSVSDVTLKRLERHFGGSTIVAFVRLARDEAARMASADAEAQQTFIDQFGGAKKILLDVLDLQEQAIELTRETLEGQQEFAIEAEQAISAIPGREAVEQLAL